MSESETVAARCTGQTLQLATMYVPKEQPAAAYNSML